MYNDGSLTAMNSNIYKPVDTESEVNVYDLTTKKEKVDLDGSGTVSGSGFDYEIADHDPSLFPSTWEAYSRNIG